MSCQRNAGKITVPDDLRDVLLEFTISYLLEQPGDIIDYAVDFFTRLRDARRTQLIQTDAQTCSSTPDESVDEGESRRSLFSLSLSFLSLSLSCEDFRNNFVNDAYLQLNRIRKSKNKTDKVTIKVHSKYCFVSKMDFMNYDLVISFKVEDLSFLVLYAKKIYRRI